MKQERCKPVKQQRAIISGFTIVELLIVIVVIAILATVTVVAYNGIQEKATTSKLAAAVNVYVKTIGLHKAENGTMPYPTTEQTFCLGTMADYPAKDGFAAGECVYWGESEDWRRAHDVNTTFNADLLRYTNTLPSTTTSVIVRGDAHYRGATYHSTNYIYHPETYSVDYIGGHIHYFLQGTKACPVGKAYTYDDLTECIISIDPPEDDYIDNERHGGEG